MNKQITEDYVSYEIAKLLKEKGFPQQEYINTFPYYTQNGNLWFGDINTVRQRYWVEAIAITQSLALKWLREVHKLHIYAKPYWPQGDMRNKMSWQGFIVDLNTINGDSQCYTDSFEEAIESRIKFALENLI